MQLTLIRKWFDGSATVGELYVDGVKECYTLEDEVRENDIKIPGRTAIPAGSYTVKITESVRFKTRLPILLNVPMFEGIRIHAGNTTADTEGCILVGRVKAKHAILESRLALEALINKLDKTTDDIVITIINEVR